MRKRAAALSIFSNTSVLSLKLITALFTGSVSILSEALHSATDLLASLMAYFSVKKAEEPADERHPFGHGKVENISGLLEGGLVLVAAGLIVWHSIERLVSASEVRLPWLAFAVMVFTATINFFVSRYLMSVSRKTDSMALRADALHLSVDVYTSAAVASGLLLLSVTGWRWVDPVFAILIAVYIFYEGGKLVHDAIHELLDRSLPEKEIKVIEEVLRAHADMIKDYHDIRTRKAGPYRYVDLHLTVCQSQDIATVHRIMDQIEDEIKKSLPNTDVVIHPEPCTHHHDSCPKDCYWLKIRKGL